MTIELRPTAPIAGDALLPGDPGRALALAQDLLPRPRMSNHHRGLWGYYGETPEGRPLTIQATGIGGPSAAVVLGELAELGVSRAVRVGLCAGRAPGVEAGDLLLVTAARALDGTSRSLGAPPEPAPDGELTHSLAAAGAGQARPARVSTADLWGADARGVAAVEMAAAPLFALGARLGVAVGCLLIVSESAGGSRLADDALAEAELTAGRIAARALAESGASGALQPSAEPSGTSSAA